MKKNIKYLISSLYCLSLYGVSLEQAYIQLAQAFQETGNIEQTIINYKKALESNCTSIPCCIELGKLLFASDKPQALFYFDAALAHDSNNIFAAQKALELSFELKQFEKALVYNTVLLKHSPDAQTYYTQGIILNKCGNINSCIQSFKQAILLHPDFYDAYYQLATAFYQQLDFTNALETYDKLLVLKPTSPVLQFEKANILVQLGHFEQAVSLYLKLMEVLPNNTTLLLNLALTLRKLGSIDESLKYYEQLLKLDPRNAEFHASYAYTHLLAQNYETGFEELALSNALAYNSPALLTTIEQVQDKTIFIPADWCLDSTIQFLRYVPLLKRNGAKIIMQTGPTLLPVLKNCSYIDTVISMEESIPQFDFFIPITSLPALFKTKTEETIKQEEPYIWSDQTLVQKWQYLLPQDEYKKIGIYWHIEEPKSNEKENRNIPFNFIRLLTGAKNSRFYCLHKQKENPVQMETTTLITHLGSGFEDINERTIGELMAVIHNLDLLITRDCLLAHVAGAMGKKVIVCLPFSCNWRWGLTTQLYPCYKDMTIMRQTKPGQWNEPLQALADLLKNSYNF